MYSSYNYSTVSNFFTNPLKKNIKTDNNITDNRIKTFKYLASSSFVNNKQSYKSLTKIIENPNLWGPKLWLKIHLMSIDYYDKPTVYQKKWKLTQISKLPSVIPCQICSKDTLKYISNNIDLLYEALESRQKLILFFFNFHNYVNNKLGKNLLQLDEFKNMYNIGWILN